MSHSHSYGGDAHNHDHTHSHSAPMDAQRQHPHHSDTDSTNGSDANVPPYERHALSPLLLAQHTNHRDAISRASNAPLPGEIDRKKWSESASEFDQTRLKQFDGSLAEKRVRMHLADENVEERQIEQGSSGEEAYRVEEARQARKALKKKEIRQTEKKKQKAIKDENRQLKNRLKRKVLPQHENEKRKNPASDVTVTESEISSLEKSDSDESHFGHSHLNSHGHDSGSGRGAKEVFLIKLCISVSVVFMLAEIIVGYQFNSIALVADAYHMLSDICAFIVQLYASELIKLKPKSATSGFTYGFGRTQIIANLVQGVMILALCLTISLESMQRLYSPENQTMPPLVVGIAFLALVWNTITFFMFSASHAGHSHGHAHTHSHEFGHKTSQDRDWQWEDGTFFKAIHPIEYRQRVISESIASRYNILSSALPVRVQHSTAKSSALNTAIGHYRAGRAAEQARQDYSKRNLTGLSRNPKLLDERASEVAWHEGDACHERTQRMGRSALAIHAIGDAAGNVAVIVDGLASWMFGPKSGKISGLVTHWEGIGYVDPICSLAVIWIILSHSFPLVSASSYALMQAIEPGNVIAYRKAFERKDQFFMPSHLRHDWRTTLLGASREAHIPVFYLADRFLYTYPRPELHVWQLSETSQRAEVKLQLDRISAGPNSLTSEEFDALIHDIKMRIFYNSSIVPNKEDMIPPHNITIEISYGPSTRFNAKHQQPAHRIPKIN